MKNSIEEFLKKYMTNLEKDINISEENISQLREKLSDLRYNLRSISTKTHPLTKKIIIGVSFASLGLMLFGSPTLNTIAIVTLAAGISSSAGIEIYEHNNLKDHEFYSKKADGVIDEIDKLDKQLKLAKEKVKEIKSTLNNMPILIHGKLIKPHDKSFEYNFDRLLESGLSIEAIVYAYFDGTINDFNKNITSKNYASVLLRKKEISKYNETVDAIIKKKRSLLKKENDHFEQKQKVDTIKRRRRSLKYQEQDNKKEQKM